jgi:hypothetical protein
MSGVTSPTTVCVTHVPSCSLERVSKQILSVDSSYFNSQPFALGPSLAYFHTVKRIFSHDLVIQA